MLLEVSEGKLTLDQMNDDYERAMFNSEVETIMRTNTNIREADFVRIFRGGLIEAPDEPGLSAAQRCQLLLGMDK